MLRSKNYISHFDVTYGKKEEKKEDVIHICTLKNK